MATVVTRSNPLARKAPPASRISDFRRAFAAIKGPKAASEEASANDSPFGPRILRRSQAGKKAPLDPEIVEPPKPTSGEGAASEEQSLDLRLSVEAVEDEEALPLQVVCAECNLEAEDVLLLNCSHVLCLGCATQVTLRDAREVPASFPGVLKCPQCFQKTALAEGALETLCGIAPTEGAASKRKNKLHATLLAPRREDALASETLLERLASAPREWITPPEVRSGDDPGFSAVGYALGSEVSTAKPELQKPSALLKLPEREASLNPLALLSPPYGRRASRRSCTYVCSVCSDREGVVYCRSCIRAFCESCAVETHFPKDAKETSNSAAARLKLHKFASLKKGFFGSEESADGVARALTTLARASVEGTSHLHSTADDPEEHFVSLAEALGRVSKGLPDFNERDDIVRQTALAGGWRDSEAGPEKRQTRRRPQNPVALSFVHGSLAARPPPLRVVEAIACEEHPSLPVQFYCRTCEAHCVCAECCVEGPHALHQLVAVSTAWEEAAADVEGRLLPMLERHSGEVEALEALLQERRLEWAVRLREDEDLLLLNNAHCKQRLQAKKETVAEEMKAFVERFCRQCDGFMALISEKLKVLDRAAMQVAEGKGALSPELVFDFLESHFDETQTLLDAKLPQQFEHLPQSRNALVDNFAAVASDLRRQMNLFGQKLREKALADRSMSASKGTLF